MFSLWVMRLLLKFKRMAIVYLLLGTVAFSWKKRVHMKVAFIGSHGTGKTTLCYDFAALIKKKGFSVSIVSEVSREAIKRGLPINENTTVDAQGWILLNQMAKEIEALHESQVVVCDRSVIDNYIYMLNKFGPNKFYEDIVFSWIKANPYNFLFKVPIVGDPEHDGVRATDVLFQKEIDNKLEDFIKERSINCVNLSPDERDSWIEIVSNEIVKQTDFRRFLKV